MLSIPAPHSRRRLSRAQRWNIATAFIFLAPVLVLAATFDYVPALKSFRLMFYDWNLINDDPTFIGLDNFRTIFADDRFRTSLKNSGVYVAALVPLQVCIPLAIAVAVRSLSKSRLSSFYRAILFLPAVISLPAASVVWLWMLNPYNGIVNQVGTSLGGGRIDWLNQPRNAMISVIVVATWSTIGFNFLLYLAALEGVAKDLKEAARLDGAEGWRLFRDIEFPLISPTFFFVVLTTVLFVNNEIFGVINVLTQGGPYSSTSNVLFYLYERGFKFFQAGEASALAILIVSASLLFTWVQMRFGEKWVHYG
ncbi:sugar ABC transporter permease [soil metagenome]